VIEGSSNVAIRVDGRLVGTTPLASQVNLPSGTHRITATKNGYKLFSQDIALERDGTKKVTVHLEGTRQRLVAQTFFGAGAVGVVTGVVCTFIAASHASTARDILNKRNTANLTSDDLTRYDSAWSSRDGWMVAAGIGYGVGAAAILGGALLYLFDEPDPERSAPIGRPAPESTHSSDRAPS
jgi:hypothetical protein